MGGHHCQPSPLAVGTCCHPTAPRGGAGRGLWPLLPARSPSGQAWPLTKSRRDGALTDDALHIKQQQKTPFPTGRDAPSAAAPFLGALSPCVTVAGGGLVFQTICRQLRWLPRLPKRAGFVQTGPFTWGGTSEGHDPCRAALNPSETQISFSTLPVFIETKVPNQLNTQPPPQAVQQQGRVCERGVQYRGYPCLPGPRTPQPPTVPLSPSRGRSRDVAGGLRPNLLGLGGGFLPLPSSGLKACVKGFFKRPLPVQHHPPKTQGTLGGKAVLTLAKTTGIPPVPRSTRGPSRTQGLLGYWLAEAGLWGCSPHGDGLWGGRGAPQASGTAP